MQRLELAGTLGGGALLLGMACAPSAAEHTFELREENGVPVAVNSAVPRYQGELFVYEKVLEIRADPAHPDSLLYEPRTFTLGDDGLFYVADTGNDRVAVFDASGRLLRAIGHAGDGPGELRSPWQVRVDDGILTVAGSDRTSRFRADGSFLDEVRSPSPPIHRARDGRIVTFDNPQGPRDDGYYWFGLDAVVHTADGERLTRISGAQVRFARMGGGRDRHELHYGPRPVAELTASDEILLTTGAEPVVRWYDLDGRLVRIARIDREPETVSAADRAALEEHFDRLIEAALTAGSEPLAEQLRARKAALRYAESRASWRGGTTERAGWVWLREPGPDVGIYVRGSPQVTMRSTFLILDPRGEFVGTTSWPDEARYFGSRIVRGHLLTLIPDPEGGETIPTVYRIRPARPDLAYPGG